MSELRERLDRELATVTPSVAARAEVGRRLDWRTRRRRVAVPATALLITAAIVGSLTYAFRSVRPTAPAEATSIPMPGEPFQAIVDGDALWALTTEPGCDGPACRGYVVKVDTLRGEVTAEVPVTSPMGLTAGAGSIWLASFTDATLIRLDPETAEVEATIPLVLPGEEPGSDWRFLPTHVDANEDGVWVSTARGAVARVDPATDEVVEAIPLPPESLGGVTIGQEGIWLDNGLGGVIKVDLETHEAEAQGSIDDEAGRRLSVGTPIARGGSLWLVGNWARPVEELGEKSYDGVDGQALVRIEESTGEVSMIIDLPKQPCCAWLLDDGDVWLVEGDGASLRRLDTDTGHLGEAISLPFGRPLLVSGTSVWSAAGQSVRRWELPRASGARETTEACEQGPWIEHCPEADWARSVATTAGMDILDERGVLIVGPPDGGEFTFWAMDPALHSQVEPLAVEIADSTMIRAGAVDGIPIYSSRGGEEFVWSVHGLNLWVAEEVIGSPPPRNVIAALVRASSSVPYRTGSAPSTYQRCLPPRVRPTFLPWLDAGEEIPRPRVSYDAEIDRAQLSWSDPAYPQGDAGVGLTVYPHTPMGNAGEETDIVINGVAGRLHRFDEANVIGLSWDFPGRTCNFMELSLVAPDLSRSEAVSDLIEVARSMR